MSTQAGHDQPAAARDWSYSRGWRRFSVIVLRRMATGPAVDLSPYQDQRLSASTLRAATADIMADITALLAKIRQGTPPAVPYDPAAGGGLSSSGTDGGSPPSSGTGAPQPDETDLQTSGQA